MTTKQVTVKSGDTLSQIALDFGIDVGSISGYSSGNPNLIYPGEVLTLGGVGSSIDASAIQPTTNFDLPSVGDNNINSLFGDSVSGQVDSFRATFEDALSSRQDDINSELDRLRGVESDALDEVGTLTTPFAEDLEAAERDRLFINDNFEANQALINELEQLLTEGNALIEEQLQVTGLASIRNPRIQKTMDDIAARTGVIQAVINARNGQIAVATSLIDRTIAAISLDRNNQLSYYETILELNRVDILNLEGQAEDMANMQIGLIEHDLLRAEATADYIKELLIDPGTASLMGEAGVSLNDSIEEINIKLGNAVVNQEIRDASNKLTSVGGVAIVDPASVPEDRLASFVDGNGVTHYYKMPSEDASSVNQLGMSFEEFLALAQEGQNKTFGQELRDELKRDFDALNVIGEKDIQAWVNSVRMGFEKLEDVPESMRDEVRRLLN